MAHLKPTSQPAAGGTVTVTVPLRTYRDKDPAHLTRVLVVKKAGSATKFDAVVSTDSAAAERAKQIAKWTGVTVVDEVGTYPYREDNDGNLYVKITPDAGADNEFEVHLWDTPEAA